MGSTGKNLSVDELCQPEILSLDIITSLLIGRGMPKENILNADRSELLSYYNKLILPLPQRINRRTKSQCQNGNDTTNSSPNGKTTKYSSDDKQQQQNSSNPHHHHNNNIDNSNKRLNLKKRLNPDTTQSDSPQSKRLREPIKWP